MTFKKKETNEKFDFKDRTYLLLGITPITYSLNVRHSEHNPLQWFDDVEKTLKSIRYATNQKSPFEEEQTGYATLGQVVFEDGKLIVPKENAVLQKILSVYHPFKDIKYYEFNAEKVADEELSELDLVFNAQKTIREMPIEDQEAIARVLWKSKITKMTSGEIKRDLLVYAKTHPQELLDLANDEDIKLRNLAIRAVEFGVLELKNDGRTFAYTGGKKEKILDIEFGKNPYTELASFFKTDEGFEVMKNITSKL